MTRALGVLALLIVFSGSVASAQGVGFVAGGTIDPEQFYAGTFFETPSIGGGDSIRPRGEWGGGEGGRNAGPHTEIHTPGPNRSGWAVFTRGGAAPAGPPPVGHPT